MRYLLALAPLALLAACGGNQAANNASASSNAANASAPAAAPATPAVTMAPVAPGLPDGAPVQAAKAQMIAECTAEMGRNLPPGSDAAAYCNCAVDAAMSGSGMDQASEACASHLIAGLKTN